jgi:hypothetical protein
LDIFYSHRRPPTGFACLLFFVPIILAATLSACGGREDLPPPRPTVVVVTAIGPYSTTFEDESDWLVGEGPASFGRVEDGRYVLGITEANTLAWTHQQRIFGDAVYEVEATLIHGAEASGFGLLLLGSSDMGSFIYCMITGDGRYDIGTCENSCRKQESLIGGYTLAPTILPDGQTNHLRVELTGGQLTFTVNGAAVSQVKDITYSAGLLGLIGESSAFGRMEAAFDNLRVTE